MWLNEFLNQKSYEDRYEIPTIAELKAVQNGKPDNFLTGKKLSMIFQYFYTESDCQMELTAKKVKEKGYEVVNVLNDLNFTILFDDSSSLTFKIYQ